MDIGGHVGGIAMQVEQGLRARAIGGNPMAAQGFRRPEASLANASVTPLGELTELMVERLPS